MHYRLNAFRRRNNGSWKQQWLHCTTLVLERFCDKLRAEVFLNNLLFEVFRNLLFELRYQGTRKKSPPKRFQKLEKR